MSTDWKIVSGKFSSGMFLATLSGTRWMDWHPLYMIELIGLLSYTQVLWFSSFLSQVASLVFMCVYFEGRGPVYETPLFKVGPDEK